MDSKKRSWMKVVIAFATAIGLSLVVATSLFVVALIVDHSLTNTSTLVLSQEDFDLYLSRDLLIYFERRYGEGVEVKYEILNEDPYVAVPLGNPRYYLWVQIWKDDMLINEGQSNATIPEEARFSIGWFNPKDLILEDPEAVCRSLPDDICQEIKLRAAQ